jgi:hypothetical protein
VLKVLKVLKVRQVQRCSGCDRLRGKFCTSRAAMTVQNFTTERRNLLIRRQSTLGMAAASSARREDKGSQEVNRLVAGK